MAKKGKDGLWRCPQCERSKPIEAFGVRYDRPGQPRSYCKSCESTYNYTLKSQFDWSSYRRKRRYGIDAGQYEKLVKRQSNLCAICETKDPKGRTGTWHVDHDHSCCPLNSGCAKCIRGLLCARCNRLLGLVNDRSELLHRAAAYLSGERPLV